MSLQIYTANDRKSRIYENTEFLKLLNRGLPKLLHRKMVVKKDTECFPVFWWQNLALHDVLEDRHKVLFKTKKVPVHENVHLHQHSAHAEPRTDSSGALSLFLTATLRLNSLMSSRSMSCRASSLASMICVVSSLGMNLSCSRYRLIRLISRLEYSVHNERNKCDMKAPTFDCPRTVSGVLLNVVFEDPKIVPLQEQEFFSFNSTHAHGHTHAQTHSRVHRHTQLWTDRQAYRQEHSHTLTHTLRHAYMHSHTLTH